MPFLLRWRFPNSDAPRWRSQERPPSFGHAAAGPICDPLPHGGSVRTALSVLLIVVLAACKNDPPTRAARGTRRPGFSTHRHFREWGIYLMNPHGSRGAQLDPNL